MKQHQLGLMFCAAMVSATLCAKSADEPNEPIKSIDKRDKELSVFNDYTDIYSDVYVPTAYRNHDDSVANRQSGGSSPVGGTAPDKLPNVDLDPISCEHPAYEPLCDEIKKAIGGGGTAPDEGRGWVNVYTGSGTRSLNPDDGYGQYRIWYKYKVNTNNQSRTYEWRSGNHDGMFGVAAAFTHTQSKTSRCSDSRSTATAKATITISVGNAVNAPSSASVKKRNQCRENAHALVDNIYITKLDVYY
mgnify:CR=1 FL=1